MEADGKNIIQKNILQKLSNFNKIMREQSKRYEIPYNSKYGYITNVKNSFKYNYEDVVRAESDANE